MKFTRLSIIVPIYNEAATLSTALNRLDKISFKSIEKEIILVDDGSNKATKKIITQLRKEQKLFTLITLTKNGGKGAAVLAGLRVATGQYTIVQDADLEYNPQDIVNLIRTAQEDESLAVFGTRNSTIKNRYLYPHYYWGSRFLSFCIKLLFGHNYSDPETCYKLVYTDLLRFLSLKEHDFGIEIEIATKLSKLGITIPEVPIHYVPRSFAEGKKIRAKDGIKGLILIAKYFANDLHYGLLDMWLRNKRVMMARRFASINDKHVVVDVGCGKQAFVGWAIRNKCAKYIGLDFELTNALITNIELRKIDIDKLNMSARTLRADRILGLAVIEHLNNPKRFARWCYKNSNSKGIVIITTPHPKTDLLLKILGHLRLIDIKEIDDHKTYFTVDSLANLFQSTGFKILTKQRFLFGMNGLVVAQK